MYWNLLLLSIILSVCNCSLYNTYAQKNNPTLGESFWFNTVTHGVACVIALIGLLIQSEKISLTTVICALFYGIIVVSLRTIYITVMRVGTMSTTTICVMYGMIIPSLAGPIFWKESIGVLQIVGISMMLISLWLINGKISKKEKPTSKTWSLLAILAFVLSGMAGVMEKIHQSTPARDEKMSFIFLAFAFMFIFSLVASLSVKETAEKKLGKSLFPLAPLLGIVIGFNATTNLILSGKLDSMIYYPIVNGGAMLLTVLVSVIVFKEKFNKMKIIGTVLGLLGILCLSLPF